jgi:polyisoprenoid-binding protein YceI
VSTTATEISTGTWQLDPVHSSIGFEVAYLAGTFRGEFHEFTGQLAVDGGSARLDGAAKVASVDVKDENLSAHLQSPDFFDAELHPELRFTADGVELSNPQLSTRGEITIKGITHPVEVTGTVSFPMTDPYGNERVGLQLTATVDRTAFGVSWNNPLPSGEPALANEVRIVTDLQFVRSA